MNTATDSEDSTSSHRLESLANFQTLILKHALSFPSVTRAVYSTCSTHHTENEAVVATVLKEMGGLFTLERALPDLPMRGQERDAGGLTEEEAAKVVRTTPGHDLTNGFFVACFKRNSDKVRNLGNGEQNITDMHVTGGKADTVSVTRKKKKSQKIKPLEIDQPNQISTENVTISGDMPKCKLSSKKRKLALASNSVSATNTTVEKKPRVQNVNSDTVVNTTKKKQKKKKTKHRPVTM